MKDKRIEEAEKWLNEDRSGKYAIGDEYPRSIAYGLLNYISTAEHERDMAVGEAAGLRCCLLDMRKELLPAWTGTSHEQWVRRIDGLLEAKPQPEGVSHG